jgi:hypothetical protein
MTREELRDYVNEQRTLNKIPYHVYSALIDGIDTLEEEPRWIPVSERLPRKDGDYLVTVRNKEYGFQYIDITTYEHSEWGYKDEWQVIAWMNAPSEYKAESEKT